LIQCNSVHICERYSFTMTSRGLNSSLAQDMNAMMPIQYSAVRPGFQTMLQSRHQRVREFLG
jgi:hypothetical protein